MSISVEVIAMSIFKRLLSDSRDNLQRRDNRTVEYDNDDADNNDFDFDFDNDSDFDNDNDSGGGND